MFQSLQSLPPDPILGLSAAYRADTNPSKVDLGVGVYKDAKGRTPVMRAVKRAEEILVASQVSKAYVALTGAAGYNEIVASLLLGNTLKQSLADRRVTVQTPGGCGGLRIAAEFIRQANPDATVWVSDPTWANHIPLLGSAGLEFNKCRLSIEQKLTSNKGIILRICHRCDYCLFSAFNYPVFGHSRTQRSKFNLDTVVSCWQH